MASIPKPSACVVTMTVFSPEARYCCMTISEETTPHKRLHNLYSEWCELSLPVGTDIVQVNIPENKMGYSLLLEM